MQAPIEPEFIALANHMADKAGEILHPAFRQPMTIENKSDASPVTLADREVEMALRQMIESAYPTHGIIGEEFGAIHPKSPWQWVIDPIDGTHAFIAGQATFTTLIALAYEDIPVLGIINQPIHNERWLGIAGKLTTLNGNPVAVRSCRALSQATLGTTALKYFTDNEAKIFDKIQRQCAKTTFGGDAYLYAKLASGEIDLVIESNLKPYDFCALKPVVEGAGGIITDWQGNAITIKSNGSVVSAASEELHAVVFPHL